MRAVILCGGQGTRLREETEFRPKPLVEVGGRPILWHIMKTFAHYNVREFILCLGYKGSMIKEYFLNYDAMNNDFTMCLGMASQMKFHGSHDEQDFRVTLADTGPETMTGGRVKRIKRYTQGEAFIVTYGDGLADIDLSHLLHFHRTHGRLATITAVRPTTRYGILDIENDGRVSRFQEKPRVDGWASAGFMIFEPAVFEYISDDSCVLEREPLERLSEIGELMAYMHNGFFYAMDTYREYVQLNDLWNSGQAPWRVWC